jgi:hypothetical protein
MVFGAYDEEASEFELRVACRTDDSGTDPEAAVEVAKDRGFKKSYTDYLTLELLLDELSRGLYPIVFLDLPNAGEQRLHAVVILGIRGVGEEGVVHYLDPELGKQERPLAEFLPLWLGANGRTIIVEPPGAS